MLPRLVLLSPHPDDAVWSLGGILPLLSEQFELLIVTFFDGDVSSQADHLLQKDSNNKWRQFLAPKYRRLENEKAVRFLGCKEASLTFVDAALRYKTLDFEFQNIDSLFESPYNDHQWKTEYNPIKHKLSLILDEHDILLVPLGIGGHIDHIATHVVANSFANKKYWYAEFPYTNNAGQKELTQYSLLFNVDLQKHTGVCQWEIWFNAARIYRSEIIRLFQTQTNFTSALEKFTNRKYDKAYVHIWSSLVSNSIREPLGDSKQSSACASLEELLAKSWNF